MACSLQPETIYLTPSSFVMTRLGNIILVAFIVVFMGRELRDLGSCMSSPLDDIISSHRWIALDHDGTLSKEPNANRASVSLDASNSPPPPPLQPNSYFHAAASDAYNLIVEKQQGNKAGEEEQVARANFNVTTWRHKTEGGLVQLDREMLGRIYGNASSVFEFGLGESTYIANHVGVPRYAGIDSDESWISMVRNKVSTSYRFYFADIGMTGNWGYPMQALKKAAYNYQAVPLLGEPQAFDVYMVDGRFRVGCLLMSFLHASSSSRKNDDNDIGTFSSPTVLVHDCRRQSYRVADHLLDLVEYSGKNLCAYKRKNSTADEQLYALWSAEFNKIK